MLWSVDSPLSASLGSPHLPPGTLSGLAVLVSTLSLLPPYFEYRRETNCITFISEARHKKTNAASSPVYKESKNR